jgi:heterodisulfide reductase subunit B
MGAHPYKVLQLHWHSTDMKPLLEKLGIDHEKAWAEFEDAVAKLKNGEKQFLTWEDCDG